jgi:hypothetical protein
MSQEDVQVRIAKKIAAIIQAAKSKAKVYHYWILGQGPIGDSFPDVLSELEDEWLSTHGERYVPWAHGYVLGYDEMLREKYTLGGFKDPTGFRLWGFYGFEKGSADKNSSDIFSVHCKGIQNALSAATKLQQVDDPNGVPEVISHGEWQITETGVYWMGDNKVHIAQGEIVVESRLFINPISIT